MDKPFRKIIANAPRKALPLVFMGMALCGLNQCGNEAPKPKYTHVTVRELDSTMREIKMSRVESEMKEGCSKFGGMYDMLKPNALLVSRANSNFEFAVAHAAEIDSATARKTIMRIASFYNQVAKEAMDEGNLDRAECMLDASKVWLLKL